MIESCPENNPGFLLLEWILQDTSLDETRKGSGPERPKPISCVCETLLRNVVSNSHPFLQVLQCNGLVG